jgi:hypothetical protein
MKRLKEIREQNRDEQQGGNRGAERIDAILSIHVSVFLWLARHRRRFSVAIKSLRYYTAAKSKKQTESFKKAEKAMARTVENEFIGQPFQIK